MKLIVLTLSLFLSAQSFAKNYSLQELEIEFQSEMLKQNPFPELRVPRRLICQKAKDFRKKLCGLSKADLTAIEYFSGSVFVNINKYLRDPKSVPAEMAEHLLPLIDSMKSGLAKLGDYEGLVKRVVIGLTPDQIEGLTVGNTVTFKAFTSTTVTKFENLGTKLFIYSKNCKYIAPLSMWPQEGEVICLPNSRFKVLDRSGNNFLLEQVLDEELTN